LVFVGQQAMAGASHGVLNGSYDARYIQAIWVNNKPTGEIGARTMLAGYFGIPVIMLSGDEAACKELHELVPEADCAIVKWGVSRIAGYTLPTPRARVLIHEKARHAMERLAEIKPYRLEGPVEVKVEFTTEGASTRLYAPREGVEHLNQRTWAFRGKDIIDAWFKFQGF
jgi:D-amino peptidase